jgi:hypothetical protein
MYETRLLNSTFAALAVFVALGSLSLGILALPTVAHSAVADSSRQTHADPASGFAGIVFKRLPGPRVESDQDGSREGVRLAQVFIGGGGGYGIQLRGGRRFDRRGRRFRGSRGAENRRRWRERRGRELGRNFGRSGDRRRVDRLRKPRTERDVLRKRLERRQTEKRRIRARERVRDRRRATILERQRKKRLSERRQKLLRQRVARDRDRLKRLAEYRKKLKRRRALRKRMRRMRLALLERRWWRKHCVEGRVGESGKGSAGAVRPGRVEERESKGRRWRCGPSLPRIVGLGLGIGAGAAAPSFADEDDGHQAPPAGRQQAAAPPSGMPSPPQKAPAFPPSLPSPQSAIAADNRFWPDQIVVQVDRFAPAVLDDEIAQTFNLDRISSETNGLLGRRIVLYRIPDQRAVPVVLAAVQADPRVNRAQPNWRYSLGGSGKEPATGHDGLLYAIDKIRLAVAHQVATGRGTRIGVIDSGVDADHVELRGSVLQRFDATRGRGGKDEAHGTAIAGIIRARGGKARGVAPDTLLLSARAFFTEAGIDGPLSSTVILLRALDWSVEAGAQVINMSFAGPKDAGMAEAVEVTARKGVILVAAAGNEGPRAKPVYPAAYRDVIAVTATDADDRIYERANQGGYLTVAAPGVDVLVLRPKGGHGFSSGTSMAAAHVSGLIALVLERNGSLDPEEVRAVLTRTAHDLGDRGVDEKFGAGRVDAAAVIQAVPEHSDSPVSVAKQAP